MKSYEYQNKNLTIASAKDILQRTEWKRRCSFSITKIAKYVTDQHKEMGGKIATKDITTSLFVKRALLLLESEGYACEIKKDFWEFPKHEQRIFGEGTQWVYLWYYDNYKQRAEQNEENV